jgi:hypothetical protein
MKSRVAISEHHASENDGPCDPPIVGLAPIISRVRNDEVELRPVLRGLANIGDIGKAA